MKEKAVSFLLWGLSLIRQPGLIPWLFKQLRNFFQGEPSRYLNYLTKQSESDRWINRFFSAHELYLLYPHNAGKVIPLLHSLSGDENEIVRQGSARSWAKLLEQDFEKNFKKVKKMKDSEKFEFRQTAALSPVLYYDREETPGEHKKQIKQFWESFVDDPRKGLRNLVKSQILDKRT